jgi:hypothetical protein
VPEHEVCINDVLIKVRKTGICGTDLHIYKWDDWAQKTIFLPMAVGAFLREWLPPSESHHYIGMAVILAIQFVAMRWKLRLPSFRTLR